MAVGGPVVGFSVWLVRLEGKRNQVAKDLDREIKDANDKIGLTNTRVGLIEGDVRELQVKSITRDDLKKVKQELTESTEKVGDRTVAEVERLVQVMMKKLSSPRAASTRNHT